MSKSKKTSKKASIIPLSDKVLIKPLSLEEIEKKSLSGIIIPDTISKEKPEQGIVVATGAGKWNEDGDKRIPVSVKVGDRVVFSKYGYDEVKLNDEEFYLLSESSILAVIK